MIPFATAHAIVVALATPSFCVPGAAVEGLAAGSWHPGTVVRPGQAGECVVRMTYSGIEDEWYLPPAKIRPAGGQPAAAPVARAPAAAGLCRAGAEVEIRLQQRWWPATVAEDGPRPDGTCRVTHTVYAGTRNDQDMALADMRPRQGVPSSGRPDVAAVPPAAVDTTPQQIYDAFRRDPAAAQTRLIGATFRVTGTADAVDDKNILFKIANYQLVAQCLFEPGDRASLRSVPEGAQVTVEGVATNQIGPYGVRLQQCHVVSVANAPQPAVAPQDPPAGRYNCMNAGSSVGILQIGGGKYTIGGVSGAYSYDPASKAFTWNVGSFARWGWSGAWRSDAVFTRGPDEPRIELTDGASLHVHCYPK